MMPEAFTGILDYNIVNDYSYTYKEPATKRIQKNYSHAQLGGNCVHPGAGRRRSSSVMGQKLRESKWFEPGELRVFCAVVETGFVVQKRNLEQEHRFGVVLWDSGLEKSKNPDHLRIYTLNDEKGKGKVVAQTLEEFWPEGTSLRINNKNDKTETPLEENAIRHQITYSQHSKRKWHNSEHYTYFCRYGPVEQSKRITDHLKWNTGSFFQKIKSLSIK